MIWFLRIFFAAILAGMLFMTVRASFETPLWQLPNALTSDPWFQATLVDAYFGFLAFFVWVAYKERSAAARGGWLVAILLLGNIAMAGYALRELFRVPADASITDVLIRREAMT